jgi:hypothetical protein
LVTRVSPDHGLLEPQAVDVDQVRWPGDIARVAPAAITVIFGFSA